MTNTPIMNTDNRVDGRAKVTGAAKYTAEFQFPGMLYGVLTGSTIAKGKIKNIDTSEAEKAAGVIAVITHKNSIKIHGLSKVKRAEKLGLGLRIFHTKDILFSGQPIALVVAERLEQAQYAATLIKTTYSVARHNTDFANSLQSAKPSDDPWVKDSVRGNPSAWQTAPVKVEQVYTTPIEVHNPMEMHATIAIWEGDKKLTLYDKNHAVQDIRNTLAGALELENDQLTINAELIGGGFGSGLRAWPHTFAAIIAAKMLNKPVKVTLSRPQMFTMVGYRPASWQKIGLGANTDGKLVGIDHEAITLTSQYEDFTEGITGISKMLYASPNLRTKYTIAPLSLGSPIWMRAPGEATGSFALETAMDELAFQLKMDPVELRKINYAEVHPDDQKPWSSNYLLQCIHNAAATFGWDQRNTQPGTSRIGDWWVGQGMALGSWAAWRAEASVRALLDDKGHLLLQSATSDMGPGTATAMTKIAADVLGIQQAKIKFELGKSNLPPSPGQGGSVTVASVGAAVHDVCLEIKKKMIEMAAEQAQSPYKGIAPEQVLCINGKMAIAERPDTAVSFADLMARKQMTEIDLTQSSKSGEEAGKYAFFSFAAHFVEVYVHAYTGAVRLSRAVSCVDAGKIINTKTAASQISGAFVMGAGMALLEHQAIDHRYGRLIGTDFAGYHIPVQADIPDIHVVFMNEPDPHLNKIGAKGLGEVGLIGTAAAIGNAYFNATGKRARHLPITMTNPVV